MSEVRQLLLWPVEAALNSASLPPVRQTSPSTEDVRVAPPFAAHKSANDDSRAPPADEPEETRGPPLADPLPEAVAAGVFGCEVTGPIELDAEQIAVLIHEHANELIGMLGEIEALQQATRTRTDPRSGRTHRDSQSAAKAAERYAVEVRRFTASYADALAAFEEGFGSDAARRLDEWARAEVAGRFHKRGGYEPGHPWHYYLAGDNAPPIPFDEISPCDEAGAWLERDLPKNATKRRTKMRELLKREEHQLAEDREQYEAVIARGAEALSRYDREIAYGGNDELARACTLALKYNHIRLALGRIAWLRERVTSQREFGA